MDPTAPAASPAGQSPADPADAWWATKATELLGSLGSDPDGLSDAEAADRLAVGGPNQLQPRRGKGVGHELLRQFSEPIVLILIAATVLAALLGDRVDAVIILSIVLGSGLLGFWREHAATVAVARLLEQVQIQVEVRRSGRVTSVPPEDVVAGDLVVLNAGDIVPCDSRVVEAQALQVDESALTGETYPRHKRADPAPADAALAERHSALFQGSHVVSGQGVAVAVATGAATELGQMSQALSTTAPRTSFEKGSARFGLLLTRVTAVLTGAILLVNIVLGRPIIDAILFSLALAVGVTPQLLPAIVAISLSVGARRMAQAKVIVRRLDAIEDLGSMDVLCTDKTGTLTEGSFSLFATLDADGRPSDGVAEAAAVNALLQTGFTNPLDEAILARHRPGDGWRRLNEIPFDFERKRLAVLVDGPGGPTLVTKGAYAKVLDVCLTVATEAGRRPIDEARSHLDELFSHLSSQGYRVLAIAQRSLPGSSNVTTADEREMTFVGFLVFEDPPKQGLERTVAGFADLGIRLCILTGDNHLTASHVAQVVGVSQPRVMTGATVDQLDDHQLALEAQHIDAFAELTPSHKERIIVALRSTGSVVGYLGDGINDAAPLHLADVGISVDTAVDVAKSAAAMVLLDKNLDVVGQGVGLGRQTFANTLKYVYTTISANFGNTVSMAVASAFLPFLPLLPRQILLLNFLSDLPSVTIAQDRVDPEDVATPRRWDLQKVRNFMVVFGLLSTAFDLLTFAVLLQIFHADADLFRTGWFVGSALTELAVLFVLRTRRVVFRSIPGRALFISSLAVALLTMAIPFMPFATAALGLTRPPALLVLTLLGITGTYIVAAEFTKRVYYSGRHTIRSGVVEAHALRDAAQRRQRKLEHIAREHGGRP